MPPPILNDSEDDDDDVVYDDPQNDNLSRSSAESAPGISTLDETRDTNNQSTGSTERLKRQIKEAQMNLFAESSELRQEGNGKAALGTSGSPSLGRNKRMHSDNFNPDPPARVSCPTAKRTKTMTTHSTKKPTSSSVERETFLAKFGEDAVAPNTSQSARFPGHSGGVSSGALPTGSMQNEFINHEPAMFKESSSTVPDNESSHQRMVEQALGSKPIKGASSPGIKLVASDEDPKSSSFPWSASEPTDSTRSHRMENAQGPPATSNVEHDLPPHQLSSQVNDPSRNGKAVAPGPFDLPESNTGAVTDDKPPQTNDAQRSSPTAEIKVAQAKAPVMPDQNVAQAAASESAGARRKRYIQEESSEPLDSDDIAVGLPKECYKPRPSKRRATQVANEQIDYSVIPEKTTRSKRSKTVGDNPPKPENTVKMSGSPAEERRKSNTSKDSADLASKAVAGSSSNDQAAQPSETLKPSPVVEISNTRPSQSEPSGFKEPVAAASQASSKYQHDDSAFVKPAPNARPAKKSKRSSTTIFEDHVDFSGKERSPSLSQQQALRHSALQDVKNEAFPTPARRGRKPVILDEEDELASEPARQGEQADEPPKKRGRGRPPKDAAKNSAPAASGAAATSKNDTTAGDNGQSEPKVQPKKRRGRPPKSTISESKTPKDGDSEADDNDEPQGDEEEEEEEPPKKRRGRPPKSAPAPSEESATKPSTAQQEEDASAKESIETSPATETPSAKQSNASKIPTPSPEKQTTTAGSEMPAPQKPPAKTSPGTHSPAKNSSPAPYRVGLSKKHRIPSLLRVVRPPPPRKG